MKKINLQIIIFLSVVFLLLVACEITTSPTISEYTVTFDGNTNTGGSTASQNLVEGLPTALRANGFTKTGYTFAGWSTTAGGSVEYADQAIYRIGAGNVTLYAVWTENPPYSITYNGNGNTSGTVPEDNTDYGSGDFVTVLDNSGNLIGALIRDGIKQRFVEWNTQSNGGGTTYMVGSSFSITGSTTLYAIYTSGTDVGRKIGPAGGLVFYDAGSIYSWGRYLEAAPSDQSTSFQWYNGSYITTGATGTAIGTGQANTTAIVGAQGAGSYAAQSCDDYELNGYTNWFLPSKDELNWMYAVLHKAGVGDFTSSMYWSSSEYSSTNAWYQYFNSGVQQWHIWSKLYDLRVRAVRAF